MNVSPVTPLDFEQAWGEIPAARPDIRSETYLDEDMTWMEQTSGGAVCILDTERAEKGSFAAGEESNAYGRLY